MDKVLENKSVIIYGPAGSGKSLNAEAMRIYFGLNEVFDRPHDGTPVSSKGILVLTQVPPPYGFFFDSTFKIFPVEAMRASFGKRWKTGQNA